MKLARKGHVVPTPSMGAIQKPITVPGRAAGQAAFH
jgi:hypothetical protein